MNQESLAMTQPTTTPEGYVRDAQGRLVPESMVKPIDKLRDQTVHQIVKSAMQVNESLRQLKMRAFDDIAAFVDTSVEQFGVRPGGNKGNVTLHTFDGRFKVIRSNHDTIKFDERLRAAKALIDECITAWSEGSRDEIKVLVNDAFRVDKEGDVSTSRVLGLRRLNIVDPKWQRAMQAISESFSVVGSRLYVRVYERVGDSEEYKQIPLDIASV
jgi:hypothetical protein